jgi:hypothetical protein
MAGGIDKGDRPALLLDAVRPDVLGDPTRLSGDDVDADDPIQQGGLAVVDVSEEGDHRRSRFEGGRIVFLLQLGQEHGVEVQEQLLQNIANRISRLVRPIDLVGHIQQDEFLIAMYYQNQDDARCRNFKRVLHDVNHRSYKTAHGFLNIQCAMAMSMIHKGNMPADVQRLIDTTHNKLQHSADMGFREVAV